VGEAFSQPNPNSTFQGPIMQHFNKSIAAICLAAASTFAQAQQATYEFDISAQPASQVLDALAKQTGLQPFFAEDAVKGKPSPGVKGKYNLREALDKALAGTGLTYQFTGEKAVAIKAAEKAIARTLNKIDEIQLQEVVVTATKSELSVSDSPAAVTVITKKAISDRNVSRITDALGVTPSLFMGGAMDGQMNGGTGVSSITLRGMDTSRIGVLVDGQSLMDSYTNKIDFRTIFTDDVERVEIVPGPFSSLYGSNGMGGVINIITKQPTEKETTLRVKRGFGDAAGNDVSLYYRNKFENGLGIVAGLGYQDREGYVNEFVVRSPVAGAAGTPVSGALTTTTINGQPAYIVGDKGKVPWTQMNALFKLTYDLSPRTKVYGGVAYNTYKTGYSPYNTYLRDAAGNSVSSGTLGINGQRVTLADRQFATNVPMEQGDLRYYGGFEGVVNHDYKVKLELSRNIKRNWYNAAGTGSFAGGNGTHDTTPNEAVNGLAQLSFPLGTAHYLVTGVNVNRERLVNKESWTLANWRDTASKTSIVDGSSGESTTVAVFAQDEIALSDELTVYVGGRFDRWETSGSNFRVGTGAYNNTYPKRSDSAFSPKLSAVFRATNELTLRTSVGQSFRAPNPNELYTSVYCAACSGGRYFFNDPSLKPEIATSWEFGGDWRPTDKVRTTASVYQTNIKDMIYSKALSTTTAPATGPDEVKVNAGEARVKGIELTGTLKLTRWLDVFLSYSYMDSAMLKNNADSNTVGKRLINVPKNLMTIGWNANYGPWSGILETRFAGKVFTTALNTDTAEGVPGGRDQYTLTNVKVSYRFDKSLKASLAINNLTDAKIYQNYLMPGRNLTAEIGMTF
jgi:iron complex outermembrane receptor protein